MTFGKLDSGSNVTNIYSLPKVTIFWNVPYLAHLF